MGIHSVCVSIFRRHWYYIYIFCWFISIYWSWMFAILICSTIVFEARVISWNATLRRLSQLRLVHYTVAAIVLSNGELLAQTIMRTVITFTTLIIVYEWLFVLYAFCAITNLRDSQIDTKCYLSEELQQMYVECGVALSWVAFACYCAITRLSVLVERETEIFPGMLFHVCKVDGPLKSRNRKRKY